MLNTPQEVCEIPFNCSVDSFPAPGISLSITYLGMLVRFKFSTRLAFRMCPFLKRFLASLFRNVHISFEDDRAEILTC